MEIATSCLFYFFNSQVGGINNDVHYVCYKVGQGGERGRQSEHRLDLANSNKEKASKS